jgi:hypothetical protein
LVSVEFALSDVASIVGAALLVRGVSAVSALNVPLEARYFFPPRVSDYGAHQNQVHVDLYLCVGDPCGDLTLGIIWSGGG